ncbi:hypothetical protein BJY00DRAFT_273471 [Aspergillus carlsbadensis]|nr:hypothetical protein BJY00DRAFT_273471 [Aspergillus carlsbadensis]
MFGPSRTCPWIGALAEIRHRFPVDRSLCGPSLLLSPSIRTLGTIFRCCEPYRGKAEAVRTLSKGPKTVRIVVVTLMAPDQRLCSGTTILQHFIFQSNMRSKNPTCASGQQNEHTNSEYATSLFKNWHCLEGWIPPEPASQHSPKPFKTLFRLDTEQ